MESVGTLVEAVAVLPAAAVVVGQALQRGPGGLPVAAPAGVVAAGLGAQQPTRVDLVGRGPLPRGRRRLAVGGPPAGTLGVAAAALRRLPLAVGRPPVDAVAGAAARPSRATLPPPCFASGGWSRR
jgi:hypothetical protein